MGAANCCKKPTEIVIEEIKEVDGEKLNALDQDSYPKDTEKLQVDENYQQEVSNQKLYEQEGSPQIGREYEVPINVSSPEQYKQFEAYENNNIQPAEYQIQNQQIQNNQIPQEELAKYNLNNQIPNQPVNINAVSIQQPSEVNKFEIQQSNVSNTGPVDITTLASQRSAAPINQIQKVVKTQQVISNIVPKSQIANIPQISSQIPIKEKEGEEEDLNKYFQMPPGQYTNILTKSKTSIPNNLDMNEIQKLIDQHQTQQPTQNVTSVSPITDNNNDINQYFQNIKPEDIINMKDLPETIGSSNINNNKPKQEDKKEEKEVPLELKHIDVNVNESLPESFGTFNIQQIGLKQHPENATTTTTTTVTKTTGNLDVKDLPQNLTNSQIQKIIDMKDLPATFGSNNINNLQQTTTTTTTKTTGDINLNNIPQNLTNSQIQKILDMKDLPETFGSNNIQKTTVTTTTTTAPVNVEKKDLAKISPNIINNPQQPTATTTTTTKTTSNIDLNNLPQNLTMSQIQKIIDMKDLPETIGSNTIQNMPKTTTTTITKTTQNTPIDLNQFGIEQSIPQISTQPNKQITTVTKTVQSTPVEEDYSKYFQQGSTTQTSSTPIDLKELGLSNILQGSNITFQKQPSQKIVSSINANNYVVNQPITTKNSTPITTPVNINNYLNLNQNKTTTTTNVIPTTGGVAFSAINSPINYGLSNVQPKTITTTTTTKTIGIPTGNVVTQSYTLPTNYGQNQVTTSKVAPQNLQYSNTMPINIANSGTKKLW